MAGRNVEFCFPPMQSTEIRLLSLRPALYFGYPIICSLNPCGHSAAKRQYEALSYVWGMDEAVNLQPITVNDKTYYITRNLDSALRHLRYKNHGRALWVDAICLNQNDVEEKNRVVPEMHLIYGSAKGVIAWVGKADEGTSMAVNLVKMLSETGDEPSRPTLSDTERQEYLLDLIRSKQSNGQLPEADSKRWTLLNVLFSHEWWDRVWTLQEVVHAKNYKLVWGFYTLHTVSGRDLAKAVELVRHLEVHGLISNSIVETLLDSFYISRRLTEIEKFRKTLHTHELIPLGAALAASRNRAATNKRDHVYGCLSLPGAGPRAINVDYDREVLRVFEDATRALVDEGQSRCGGLNFLAACQVPTSRKLNVLTPSWTVIVDQINDYDPMCTPFGGDLRFTAAGSHLSAAVYSARETSFQGPSILTVRGQWFDQIETVGTVRVPVSQSLSVQESEIIMRKFYEECRNILLQARGTRTADSDHSAHADLFRTFICDWTISAAEMPVEDEAWSPAYMRSVKSCCSGRRFVLTSSGFMGLAPHAAESGDHVFLIAGCDVPLILRKLVSCATPSRLGDDENQYPNHIQSQPEDGHHISHANECYQIVGNACECARTSIPFNARNKLTKTIRYPWHYARRSCRCRRSCKLKVQ